MGKKKDKGWIKLYRQLTDNKMWTSKAPFDRRSAWIDLLLIVNHELRIIELENGELVTVGVGQCFTSLDHLAERWHWSRNRVDRYLSSIVKQGMCRRTGTPRGTLLTIVNYEFYQYGRNANGATNDTTNDETGGATTGTRTRIYENYIKNDKEVAAKPPAGSSFSGDY